MENKSFNTLINFYNDAGIDVTSIRTAGKILGEERLLKIITKRIKNCECTVEFGFAGGVQALEQDDYIDLVLIHHWLKISKSVMTNDAYSFIMKRFNVHKIKYDESFYFFEIYADEGPFANGIEETIDNINHVLVPSLKRTLGSIDIHDFYMTFLISKFY